MELDRPSELGLGGYVVRTQDSHSLTGIGAKDTLLSFQGSLLERCAFGNSALNRYFKGNRDFAPGPLAARGAFRGCVERNRSLHVRVAGRIDIISYKLCELVGP